MKNIIALGFMLISTSVNATATRLVCEASYPSNDNSGTFEFTRINAQSWTLVRAIINGEEKSIKDPLWVESSTNGVWQIVPVTQPQFAIKGGDRVNVVTGYAAFPIVVTKGQEIIATGRCGGDYR